jgi:hypothetical protein
MRAVRDAVVDVTNDGRSVVHRTLATRSTDRVSHR